ncbi:hypothetical protein M5K25_005148 [Dendrobium thyrsiflorum]|uniref:Uncharacterized protein n=1 Tax=Dendrobium thyrsiflorum TaxID=117978 RepID=A0ABD0VGQ8_DENTH
MEGVVGVFDFVGVSVGEGDGGAFEGEVEADGAANAGVAACFEMAKGKKLGGNAAGEDGNRGKH